MVWDTKSTGTLNNVIELLVRKKKSAVFVNKVREFKDITTVEQLEELLSYMSEHAKQKADEKIKLFDRINSLKHEQMQMFAWRWRGYRQFLIFRLLAPLVFKFVQI